MAEIVVKVHSITEDGLPDMDNDALTGRVAFIWDGAVVSGWPLKRMGFPDDCWEPSADRFGGPVYGVRHWLEFPEPVWEIGRASVEEPWDGTR